MDLKAYQPQIKELIPLRHSPDFNELLNKTLFGESTSDRFLIKMELSRLSKPCQRILDLRDKITESCTLFEQDKIEHYLTKETIKVLQDNIQLYGLYTIGAFEAVHEHIAQRKQQQQIQQQLKIVKPVKKEQCELLTLSQKNKRGAPRMFFVSEVTVSINDGDKFKAQTSNISSTGIKLKLKDNIHLQNGSLLIVMFSGLALEHDDQALKKPISYQLVKQEREADNNSYLYLNYVNNDNQAFAIFINDFIRINQFKYKIDVHYYYELAKTRALKYSYLAQTNSLVICLNKNAISPLLFVLENGVNKQLINDLRTNEEDLLPLLFNELRLCKMIAQTKSQQSTTIYTFIHKAKDKQYFLSATEEELHEKGLKALFIDCARSKVNWHAYNVTLIPFHYQPATNQSVTESTPEIFSKITHIAVLQQLTKSYPFNLAQSVDNTDVSQLNQFINKPEKEQHLVPIYSLFSPELRKEERYQYNSQLSVSDKRNLYFGEIIDFSYSGLKIKLNQINTFSITNIVTVNLIELQKISKTYQLSDLHYKVVHKGANNVLHLQVFDQATLDICQSFFSILVKNNAKHFTCQPLKVKKQPLHKQLIEIVEESFLNVIFFISKENARPTIRFSAIDIAAHPLHVLFSLYSDNHSELNYYPIANNQLYERLVITPFKEATDNTTLTKEAIIYVKTVKNKQAQWQISSFLDEDFKSEQAKLNFIQESQLNGNFYALHYRLSMLPKIELACIKSEIRSISRFATHLTKKLEEELMTVEGMIEITDRTTDIINTVNLK